MFTKNHLLTIALSLALGTTVLGKAHAAKPYETCSGKLMLDRARLPATSVRGNLGIGFETEGFCLLPASERQRILRTCKLEQPCTVIGISELSCGPDCTRIVKIISIFAGNVRD